MDATMPQQFLSGQRVYLRALDAADVSEEYLDWILDPEVSRYLEVGRFPMSEKDLTAWIESFNDPTKAMAFAIVDEATNLHIGNITLHSIDWVHRTAEMGTMIGNRQFWGKGYATEARSLLISCAFERWGLRKLTVGNVEGNIASISSNKGLGFQEEGRLRDQVFVDGKYHDVIRLGLLRNEFRPKTSGPKEDGPKPTTNQSEINS